MADAIVRVVENRATVVIPGVEALAPLVAATQSAADEATAARDIAQAEASKIVAVRAEAFTPNLWPDPELAAADGAVIWRRATPGGAQVALPVTVKNAAKAFATPLVEVATAFFGPTIPITAFPSGRASIGVVIREKLGDQGATGGGNNIRIRLAALNAAGSIMGDVNWPVAGNDRPQPQEAALYYTRDVPRADIVRPTTLVVAENLDLASIIAAGAVSIAVSLRIETNTVQAHLSHGLIRDGADPTYRAPSGVLASAGEAREGLDPAKLMTPLTTRAAVQVRDAYAMNENLYPDPMFAASATTPAGWGQPWPLVLKQGASAIETPGGGTAVNNPGPMVDISQFRSRRVSISVVIREKIGDQGLTGLRVRLRAHAPGAGNNVIMSVAGLFPTEGNDSLGERHNYYTRYLPQADISEPTQVVVAENVDLTAALAAGAVKLSLDIRSQTTVKAYISHILIRDGADPTWKVSTSSAAALMSAVVSASGNDGNAGTAVAPFATIDRALDAIGGNGHVVVVSDLGPTQARITPSKVKGQVILVGQGGATMDRPILRLSTKISGIEKVSGRTKVYRAVVAGLPTFPNFQWLYQDGVADPRTVIAAADRDPEHRGRPNRLSEVSRSIKTTATTLNAALDEMDAQPLPLAFPDTANGMIYFTIAGGGDATSADIYLDAATGLIAAGARESCGALILQGVEIRYGGANLTPFRRQGVDNSIIIGSRANALDYSFLIFRDLEVACAGSHQELNGDGLNGHAGAYLDGSGFYSHDNWDDGFSPHEWCSGTIRSGLVEYNGGCAVAVAYGADQVVIHHKSRRNQRRAGWKSEGAFLSLGSATSGNPPDIGDTRARFIGCVSIEDRVGFGDSSGNGTTQAFAECIDCLAISSTVAGYDVGVPLVRCDYAGTGTAKTVRTTSLAVTRL